LPIVPDANLIAHRTRRYIQRRLALEQRRDVALQFVNGGVIAEHIVANFGRRHDLTHLGAGFGNSIAS
jgi:hypothetical protein